MLNFRFKRNIEINSDTISYSKDEEIIIARDNVKIYERVYFNLCK